MLAFTSPYPAARRTSCNGRSSNPYRKGFRDQIRDKLCSQKRKNNSNCRNCFSEMHKNCPWKAYSTDHGNFIEWR